MAVGLTRREQWALIGVVALILAGLAVQGWRARAGHDEVYVSGQGRWQKIADFDAGQRPGPLPANVRLSTKPILTNAARDGRSSATLVSNEESGIDINHATADELDRLPGIGPARAQAILTTRQKLGGFASIEQLTEVSGIGPKTLAKLRPYVRLGGAGASVSNNASRGDTAPTSRSVEAAAPHLAPPVLEPLAPPPAKP